MTAKLVLASGSPRRQQYMTDLGFDYTADPPDIDETPLKNEKPADYVRRVTVAKAQAAATRHKDAVILAADTTVCVGRRILGKPQDANEAAAMLRLMSGRRHNVLTAVCVIGADGSRHEKLVKTAVKMKPLREKDIAAYVATPANWQNMAGGYGLQTTAGGALAQWVNGSVSGVVGLPLVETLNLLKGHGFDV